MKYLLALTIFSLFIFKSHQQNACASGLQYCDPNGCGTAGGTDCNTCIGGNGPARDVNNDCQCPTDYRDETTNNVLTGCELNCAHQCDDCTLADVQNNTNICTACKNPDMLMPKCWFLSEGYYIPNPTANPEDQTYEQCAKKCTNCENTADNCIAANGMEKCSGMNRDPNTCEPLTGFYDNNGKLQDAVKCPADCLECTSATLCQVCDESKNKEKNVFSGACECKQGYRVFDEDTGCEKCYMLSDVCVQTCPQNTVQNEKIQICETLEYEMISNATLILVLGILVGIIQIALCCFVYVCLQRKHDIMEKELHEEQMKIKQQRDHIYKNMDNYNGSVDYSKSGTGSPFKSNKEQSRGRRSQMDESNSELSSSNLQSSQVNLFNRDQNKSQAQGSQNVDLDDISSGQDNGSNVGGKRRRRRQVQ